MTGGPPGGGGQPSPAVTLETRSTAGTEAAQQALGTLAKSTGRHGHGILPVVVDGEDSPGFSPGPDIHLTGLGTPRGPADTVVTGSLGRFHLDGPPGGVFVQITGGIERDIAVPGQPFTLGKLQLAQALGESEALRGRGGPIVRLHLRDRGRGIAQLLAAAGTNASGAFT